MTVTANRPEPARSAAAAPRSAESAMSLAEALDRLIHRGVAIQGNVAVGLAGVDLLFLDLRVLLASIDTIWPEGAPDGLMKVTAPAGPRSAPPPTPSSLTQPAAAPPVPPQTSALGTAMEETAMRRIDSDAALSAPQRDAASPTPAKGLVRLVLSLVKLLHDVMERQALRRMDHDRLSAADIEAVGMALCAQATEIERLRRLFGFSERDLALELGLFEGP